MFAFWLSLIEIVRILGIFRSVQAGLVDGVCWRLIESEGRMIAWFAGWVRKCQGGDSVCKNSIRKV